MRSRIICLAVFACVFVAPAYGQKDPLLEAVSDIFAGAAYKDKVLALIASGADVNGKTADGDTTLMVAVRRGEYGADAEILLALLQRGVPVDAKGYLGGTALQKAAIECRADFIEILLDHHANINGSTEYGVTPLELASKTQHCTKSIEVLIARGAQVNSRKDVWGTTALFAAAIALIPENVKTLLAHGADPKIRDSDGRTPAQYLKGYFDGMSKVESFRAMHLRDYESIMKLLGANP